MIDYLDSDKMLLFASDYPHWHGEEPTAWMSDLSNELRERIIHTNAAEILWIARPGLILSQELPMSISAQAPPQVKDPGPG